jgi:hypothetical protein
MCDQEDGLGLPLTFARFVEFLREPPFEPCESELQYLTPVEYEQAFTEAVRSHYHKIRRYIAHITENYDLATDLAQTVFLRLYQSKASFDAPYIYRAAKNTAFNALHQDRRRRAHETRWAGFGHYHEEKRMRARVCRGKRSCGANSTTTSSRFPAYTTREV